MTMQQTISVQVNPLYLDTPQAQQLRLFFQMLGLDATDITLTPAQPESASGGDPSNAFTVTYYVGANVLEGSDLGFARTLVMSCAESDLTFFKRRFKSARDGFFADCYRQLLISLTNQQDQYAAGTFTPPLGLSMDAYLRQALQGALDLYPSIDV